MEKSGLREVITLECSGAIGGCTLPTLLTSSWGVT